MPKASRGRPARTMRHPGIPAWGYPPLCAVVVAKASRQTGVRSRVSQRASAEATRHASGRRQTEGSDMSLTTEPAGASAIHPFPGRVARAWAELMSRLGYDRYVAQGGDVGYAVTDAMALQAPDGLVAIQLNSLRRLPADVTAALSGRAPVPALTDAQRAAFDAYRASSRRATSRNRGRRRRRSATRSRIPRSASRPGSSTTTPTATRRSQAPFSKEIPPVTSPLTGFSTTSRSTG